MRAVFGAFAGAFLLASTPAGAQEQSCKLRCATIHQFFGDEIAATIPLACDTQAIYCTGEGMLRINGDAVAARIGAEFLATAIRLRIDTTYGPLKPGYDPEPSFDLPLAADLQSQAKTFVVRWQSTPAASANENRHLGGHFKLVIDKYSPAAR